MIWAILIACLGLSFILSGLEAAVLTVSRVRARHRANHSENRRAGVLDLMLRQRDRLLASVTIANSAAGTGAFLTVTMFLVRWLGASGYAWAFVIWLPVYLILFELVPKSLFPRFPYRMLEFFTPLLRILYLTLGSVASIASPLRAFLSAPQSKPDADLEAFARIAASAGKHGALTDSEQHLIRSVLTFRKLTVGEVMIPLANVTAVPTAMPTPRLIEIAHATRLDHLPVMSETGDLLGLVDVLETLRRQTTSGCACDLAHPLTTFYPHDLAISALAQLRSANSRMGGVCSPTGRALGIVGTDDILRRLFASEAPQYGQSK